MHLEGFRDTISVYVDSGSQTMCMKQVCFWSWTVFLLTWPYRWWFNCRTREAKFTYLKLIGLWENRVYIKPWKPRVVMMPTFDGIGSTGGCRCDNYRFRQWRKGWHQFEPWKPKVVMMPTLSALVAPVAVVMTATGSDNDDTVGISSSLGKRCQLCRQSRHWRLSLWHWGSWWLSVWETSSPSVPILTKNNLILKEQQSVWCNISL